jgi:LysR family transcriptional regulator, regulator for metE and metH
MDVDIRDLELLDALGEHVTLTAAARHLYVSQPALSQRLLRLEERLSTPLFERRGRRLVANAAGRRMLHAAHVTLGELRAARLDLDELADGHRRPLRLASQCATNFQWMPDVVRSLHQRLPGAEVRFEMLPDDDPIAALLDDRLDVALVTKLTGDVNRVRLERLFDDELRAVVNARHPLAARDRLTATDFADVRLVLCDSYDQTRSPVVPLPIPPGARPGRLTTIALGPDLLIETVATSDAVTVMPSWVVAPYLVSHEVVSLAVGDPPQRRTWYSATRPEHSDLVDTFVAMMHSHLAGDAPRARVSLTA